MRRKLRLLPCLLAALCALVLFTGAAGSPDPAQKPENLLTIREGCELDPEGRPAGVTAQTVVLSSEHLADVELLSIQVQAGADPEPVIQLTFTEEGARLFAEATARLVGRQLSIWVGEELLSAPYVHAAITDGQAVITGGLSLAETEELARRIRSTVPGLDPEALELPESRSSSGPLMEGLGITAFLLLMAALLL